jgi:hypothetical protein
MTDNYAQIVKLVVDGLKQEAKTIVTKPLEKSTRPVKCAVCQSQLYYENECGSEPEVELQVSLPKWQEATECKNISALGFSKYYIHTRCWNKLEITLHDSYL